MYPVPSSRQKYLAIDVLIASPRQPRGTPLLCPWMPSPLLLCFCWLNSAHPQADGRGSTLTVSLSLARRAERWRVPLRTLGNAQHQLLGLPRELRPIADWLTRVCVSVCVCVYVRVCAGSLLLHLSAMTAISICPSTVYGTRYMYTLQTHVRSTYLPPACDTERAVEGRSGEDGEPPAFCAR